MALNQYTPGSRVAARALWALVALSLALVALVVHSSPAGATDGPAVDIGTPATLSADDPTATAPEAPTAPEWDAPATAPESDPCDYAADGCGPSVDLGTPPVPPARPLPPECTEGGTMWHVPALSLVVAREWDECLISDLSPPTALVLFMLGDAVHASDRCDHMGGRLVVIGTPGGPLYLVLCWHVDY